MFEKYIGYTLVDITDSGVTKYNSPDKLGYNQNQNLNTLLQLIGLRCQPLNVVIEVLETQDVVDFCFGNAFYGLHTVWKIEFEVEHSLVFNKHDNKTYFLDYDVDGSVFITELTETVKFTSNLFSVYDKKFKNTYFTCA